MSELQSALQCTASPHCNALQTPLGGCSCSCSLQLQCGGEARTPRRRDATHNDLLQDDRHDSGSVAAVLLHSTLLDHGVWLVADDAALIEYPDIEASGFPIFFFDEVNCLRGKSVERLRQVSMVKLAFPGARMVQE